MREKILLITHLVKLITYHSNKLSWLRNAVDIIVRFENINQNSTDKNDTIERNNNWKNVQIKTKNFKKQFWENKMKTPWTPKNKRCKEFLRKSERFLLWQPL